ncbi:MAG TPA: type II secretion system protein [Tepidisphaeraceae bacterium]|nr:type II secretion system protein [Tepidisphaeraceae bacterium]
MITRRQTQAFTIVELLVVIGIIAILLSIALPVIGHVRGRSRDLLCQANLREIASALRGYAIENKGVFPYGFHWAHPRKMMGTTRADWERESTNDPEFVSWASQIGKWAHGGQGGSTESDPYNYSKVLQCPEALAVRPHYVGYAANMVVMVDPLLELMMGSPPDAQLRPAKLDDLRPDTALVWDTAIFVSSDYDVDFLVGMDIDDQRFWKGAAIPQYRYFSPSDPFSKVGNGQFGQNQPIRLGSGSSSYYNIDPGLNLNDPTVNAAPYQGNLRFRHQSETACNAAFVDGHVEPFIAVINDDDKSVRSHNALRRYFMTKWPSGASPDPNYPN